MITSFASKTPPNRHFFTVLKGHSFLLFPPAKTLTMAEMKTRPAKPKRPTCPACWKPAWLCLCARIKTKKLENSIAVTVLQHSLEKKHPLNSVIIALLGLRNVAVSAVSDVNFDAQFGIRLSESESEMGLVLGSDGIEIPVIAHKVFDKCDVKFKLESDISGVESNQNGFGISGFVESFGSPVSDDMKCFEAEDSDKQCDEKKLSNLGDMTCVGVKSFESQDIDKQIVQQCDEKKLLNLGDMTSVETKSDQNQFERLGFVENCGLSVVFDVNSFEAEGSDKDIVPQCDEKKLLNLGSKRGHEGNIICFSIGKQGVITSLVHVWEEQNCPVAQSFDTILENHTARDALARGFVVQKLQKREREGSSELEKYVEFEIEVPSGSVLLFPSDEAVSVDELKDNGFEFKNLIVLDGTWAKAKRMYAENPWLKLVPHLKLEMDKVSLYNGVRMQPKVGCLSTIESIVYALKGLEDQNLEGLDDLLIVFDSMVSDQRQCKEKRLRNASTM